jgi:hypothetical protein
MVEENGLVFGPHSPRSQLEREGDGPILENASESESENEQAMEPTVSDPLADFLVSVTKKPDQAILSLAVPSPKLTSRSSVDKGADKAKRSSRLAAKPSAGCSTMEKVQLVLMKKSGVLSDDASPQAADLQRYRKLYSEPLTPVFIDAVTALVEKNAGGKIKPAEASILAA